VEIIHRERRIKMKLLNFISGILIFTFLSFFFSGCYTSFSATKRDKDVDVQNAESYAAYSDEYYEDTSADTAYQPYYDEYVYEDVRPLDADSNVYVEREIHYVPKYLRETYYNDDPYTDVIYYDPEYFDPYPNYDVNVYINLDGPYWYTPAYAWYGPHYYWGFSFNPYWSYSPWWSCGYVYIGHPISWYPYYYPYQPYWPGYYNPYYAYNHGGYDPNPIPYRKRDFNRREPVTRPPVKRESRDAIAKVSNQRQPVRSGQRAGSNNKESTGSRVIRDRNSGQSKITRTGTNTRTTTTRIRQIRSSTSSRSNVQERTNQNMRNVSGRNVRSNTTNRNTGSSSNNRNNLQIRERKPVNNVKTIPNSRIQTNNRNSRYTPVKSRTNSNKTYTRNSSSNSRSSSTQKRSSLKSSSSSNKSSNNRVSSSSSSRSSSSRSSVSSSTSRGSSSRSSGSSGGSRSSSRSGRK
jgi:hypothetical protein